MSEPNPRREASGVPAELVANLRNRVRKNRFRLRCTVLLEALGLAISAPLAYLWLVFFVDTQFPLPLVGRIVAGLGFLAGLVWAITHLVRRWRGLRLSEDHVALTIEKRTAGGVQNRLINAVQIARDNPAAAPGMNEAVVQENVQVLERIHLEQAAQVRPALLRLGLAALIIGIGLGFWLWQPSGFANAAARIFMPLSSIDPLYRTTLTVDPGDVEATGDVTIRVTIQGERPEALTVLKNIQGKRTSEIVRIDPGNEAVSYTFRDVTQNVDYAVRGGDFTTPYYRITVPPQATFARLAATYHYPEYTRLPQRTVESAGDVEALEGTRADLRFRFDHPPESVRLIGDRAGEPSTLQRVGAKEFGGALILKDVAAYWLEMTTGNRPAVKIGPFAVRVLQDQEPTLELSGLDGKSEVQVDSVLPLRITGRDDFGLEKVGLFFRPAGASDETWQMLATWPGEGKTAFKQDFNLELLRLKAVEGDRLELALNAADTAPARKGNWIAGPIFDLRVGGEGVALQLQYEQILRSEKDLAGLIRTEQELLARTTEWLRKLDGAGDLRWDDPKNVAALHQAVKLLTQDQDRLREDTGAAARAMVAQAGNSRIAVGLLADTEMVRTLRILDSVPSRDQPQDKRAALADARLAQERTIKSLQDILEQYGTFRSDWELANMIPFAKMLADRQGKMRDQSRGLAARKADATAELQQGSMKRRQLKVGDLCQLIRPAFDGLSNRLKIEEPEVAEAFAAGATLLGGDTLKQALSQAAEEAGAGRWTETAQHQTKAAQLLSEMHDRLRQAHEEAARKLLAVLKERAKSDLEAQKELEKLPPGTAEAFVKNYPLGLKLEDTTRIREVVQKKKKGDEADKEKEFQTEGTQDVKRSQIELKKDSGVRQDTDTLTLGTKAEKTPELKLYKDQGNAVQPFIQEKFDDLVGKLLDEADELSKNYQTINLSTNRNNNDPGDISKVGGALNSTGAVAATGNKKPPTTNSGGVSRTGRQGARAHGMTADDEGTNRRGRDKALQGNEQVADQAGKMKMNKSDDMQKDTSAGVGGKKIESDDTHFNPADAGKWKDEYAKRMEKPQAKEYLVERQGDKMDPKVAEQLRDLTSKQEQVIERLKAIRKELKNLYLPTEHLQELAADLQANLESLQERPDAELFRLQLQNLERLRGAMRVFQGADGGFQPSLPRERVIRGRVLDGAANPVLPGYEDAVKSYFLKLVNP